ncbi:hypothetical protein HPY27_01540 [Brevibacillus sp. HB1.1]|uniref:GPW/gp25 family protein n=1 Tax=Brevibacillus sp. HB1.1 TaxID=2738808 RepID=UPI0015756AEF|nr:GPW/gp25 family protein [Brevibacillus sp. HB1.1]NTU28843.1 hypothetical protein [Brevibacillus sp. HB1.1]
MEHTVMLDQQPINFGAKGIEEIKQNMRTIFSTTQGSVPLDRAFGIDTTEVDGPIPVVEARYTAKIMAAIRLYEPRVTVTAVTYHQNHEIGKLIPQVKFQVKSEK